MDRFACCVFLSEGGVAMTMSASLKLVTCVFALASTGLWLTPDQAGYRRYEQGDYVLAAASFEDPMWRGVALYRAGEFAQAAEMFSWVPTAEGRFNEGNAWLLQGRYDRAIAAYDQALQLRPDWPKPLENRQIAQARARALETAGGEMGNQKIGADDIVFNKKKSTEGQETQVAGGEAMSDAAIQSMWLRRVNTKPGDFLRNKFSYQLENELRGNQP
jgi:Ca-activated chloride channel family protein